MDKYSGKFANLRRLLVIWSILGIIAVQNSNCTTSKRDPNRRRQNFDSSSSGNKTPLQKTETDNKLALKETINEVYARQLYNDYGVGDKKEYLCTNVDDGKTTRIWGEAVCRQVVKKLYGNKSFKFQVYCVELNVSHDPNGVFGGTFFEHAVKHPSGVSYQQMVRCGYTLDPFTYVYINHLREDFYFVLTHRTINDKKIIATMKVDNIQRLENYLDFSKSDFPEILLKETEDPQEADTIFGIHGIGDFKKPEVQGHVCAKPKGMTDVIFGAKICPRVLQKCDIPASEVPAICFKQKIKRFSEGIICKNCPTETEELLTAKCTGNLKGLPKSVLLINTPKDGLYYVARQLKAYYRSKDGKTYNTDWYIASVVAPEKIPEKKTRSKCVKNKPQDKLMSCLKGKNPKQSAKKGVL